MNVWTAIFGGIGTIVGALLAYFTQRYSKSGRVGTSDADTLWRESSALRDDLRDQILVLRGETASLRTEVITCRNETMNTRKEMTRVREHADLCEQTLTRLQAKFQELLERG